MGKKAKARQASAGPRRPRKGGGRDLLAGTVPVATFATLGEVQAVLAELSDDDVDIDGATIVGTDLRLVERVEGRPLTRPRAAGYGTVGGAWFGALVATLAAVFTADSFSAVLSMLFGGIVLGAAFGALFGFLLYWYAGPRDPIGGNVSLVASGYELRAPASVAERLRERSAGAVTRPASADDLLARR